MKFAEHIQARKGMNSFNLNEPIAFPEVPPKGKT